MNLWYYYASLAFSLLIASSLPCRADILLVNADGTGQYPTIQAAVDAAVDGDEVHLVAGTYAGKGNRNVDFQGKRITIRSQSLNPADVIVGPTDYLPNTERAFILDSNEGPESVLNGLSISGWGIPAITEVDGAVLCQNSEPTIRNCVFAHCYGSAFVYSGGSPLVTHCTFDDNHWGSGLSGSGDILIEDCLFTDNNGEGFGGAAFISGGTVRRCIFSGNGVYLSGGSLSVSGTLIEDCTIDGGATYYGGAIWAGDGTIIRRCSLSGAAEQGAAIAAYGSVTIESCNILGFWGRGWGDAIRVNDNAHVTLANSIIAFGTTRIHATTAAPSSLNSAGQSKSPAQISSAIPRAIGLARSPTNLAKTATSRQTRSSAKA